MTVVRSERPLDAQNTFKGEENPLAQQTTDFMRSARYLHELHSRPARLSVLDVARELYSKGETEGRNFIADQFVQ